MQITKENAKFRRITGYSREVCEFLKSYYLEASRSGVVIEGELQNPTPQQLSYYNENMGSRFEMSVGFIVESLRKWLPRINSEPRTAMATAIYDVLSGLRANGKTESVLKNAYMKIMCWIYYRFERIANKLGSNNPPKVLCETSAGAYQTALLSVLNKSGCEIVWLLYDGGVKYAAIDPQSKMSTQMTFSNTEKFPTDFCLKSLRQQIQANQQKQQLYGQPSVWAVHTNGWRTEGMDWKDAVAYQPTKRGKEKQICNCAFQVVGVASKETYVSDIFKLYSAAKSSGRKVLVLEDAPPISVDDINSIRRDKYQNTQQMIRALVSNIRNSNSDLQTLMRKAFIDVMLRKEAADPGSMERLTSKAVYLICWLKQYQRTLFEGLKPPDTACVFRLGACKNETEAMFYQMLVMMPVDVVLLMPETETAKNIGDKTFETVMCEQSLAVAHFPQNSADVQAGTVAYHAEQDLDTLLYQDTGMYRDQQYSQAEALILRTTYEEIPILWDQELKFRPNFIVEGNKVALPTIFAKVSGVKDGDIAAYWSFIKSLITPDVMLIDHVPYTRREDENPIKQYATQFWRNSRLQRTAIKESAAYQYNFLRESVQDYILDNLECFINSKAIKGTFQNGTEYIILSTVLNLKKEILQLLNRFDFTKKNPKVIYVATSEQGFSLEDTITMVFLNRLGFDVLVFVPTGYQCFEQYLNSPVCVEHQVGEYMYNLTPPKMANVPLTGNQKSWREKLQNFMERI